MSQFVFIAVLLGLLAAAFAVSALWQSSRRLALALALGLPLAAGGLYYLKGTPDALDPANRVAPRTIDDAIAMLQRQLAKDPDNLEGRVLLARSYMASQQFDKARDNYAKAIALAPQDVDLPVEYAEALMRTSPDHRFPPQAVTMLENAVEKNPQNQRALFFLGMHRMQSGDPVAASATWERLLPLLSPDAGAVLRQQINAARATVQLPPLPEPATAPGLTITLDADPTLAKDIHPGDVVFVFARAGDGPDAGPPLAVKRISVAHLPMTLSLSDADSPMPTAKLSSQKSVRLAARLSRTGTAQAASGDIEADPVTVDVGATTPAALRLSRVRP